MLYNHATIGKYEETLDRKTLEYPKSPELCKEKINEALEHINAIILATTYLHEKNITIDQQNLYKNLKRYFDPLIYYHYILEIAHGEIYYLSTKTGYGNTMYRLYEMFDTLFPAGWPRNLLEFKIK